MEYQETINTWKEYPHVLTMLTRDNYNVPQGKTFMQKFLEGVYSYLTSCLGSRCDSAGWHAHVASYICCGTNHPARSTRKMCIDRCEEHPRRRQAQICLTCYGCQLDYFNG